MVIRLESGRYNRFVKKLKLQKTLHHFCLTVLCRTTIFHVNSWINYDIIQIFIHTLSSPQPLNVVAFQTLFLTKHSPKSVFKSLYQVREKSKTCDANPSKYSNELTELGSTGMSCGPTRILGVCVCDGFGIVAYTGKFSWLKK